MCIAVVCFNVQKALVRNNSWLFATHYARAYDVSSPFGSPRRLIMDYIEQSYCANFSPWIGNFGDILELLIDLIEI